jgi:hypothetical protein
MKKGKARRPGAKRAAPKTRNPFALAARRRRAGIEPSTPPIAAGRSFNRRARRPRARGRFAALPGALSRRSLIVIPA